MTTSRNPLRRLIAPIGYRIVTSKRVVKLARWVPSWPELWRGVPTRTYQAWEAQELTVPQSLQTAPGIPRDVEAENLAFAEHPVYLFRKLHSKAFLFGRRLRWWPHLRRTPRAQRAAHLLHEVAANAAQSSQLAAAGRSDTDDQARLTAMIRERSAEIGLSAVGFAPYDERYTFAEHQEEWSGENVIVCILEQDWEGTQTAPSDGATRAAHLCYSDLEYLATELAAFLCDLGYRSEPTEHVGKAIVQHYAVEAGMGQMGLNGQLLTPQAGSRCRILLINTDAPVVRDHPMDFGIPALCDQCRICVRRCPPGAIPVKREWVRGVFRVNILEDRCFPTVMQADGCAVCMKVCPVQRYGLKPVLEEYERNGTILGAGTDELEGYDWIDGEHYGPGQRPRLGRDFIKPPGLEFDPDLKVPVEIRAKAQVIE